MKVYIVWTCHPTFFIQHASPFILSFNVKSNMVTDMLLPVILSELINSDDEKAGRSKTRERISFLNLSFFCFLCILYLVCLAFLFALSSISYARSSYSSPFCSCNLDRWSESSLLLFKLILIWCVWFFYSYYFAERFSFDESFEIRSSNIRNDVIRMKCWIKPRVNNTTWKFCWMSLKMLHEKFARNQIFIQHDFFFLCYFCILLNRSNISSNMTFLLCWIKCWIGLTRPLENSSTFTGKNSASKSLFK